MEKPPFWRRHLLFLVLTFGFAASSLIFPPQARAKNPSVPNALLGIAPLTDPLMGQISGMGLVLAKANTQSPSTGNIVLWDEVARSQITSPKALPGVRVTVNGVPQ